MRGFEYLVYSALSLSLLVVLVLLPLAPVFAEETHATSTPPVVLTPPETQVKKIETPSTDIEVLEDVVASEEVVPSVSETETDDVVDGVSIEETDAIPTEPTTDTIFLNTSSTLLSSENNTQVVDVTAPTTTQNVSGVILSDIHTSSSTPIQTVNSTTSVSTSTQSTPIENNETPSSEPIKTTVDETDALPQVQDTTSESSTVSSNNTSQELVSENLELLDEVTEEVDTEGEVMNVLANDSNKFSFSESECTMMGNGSFYCARGESAPTALHTDRIFSAIDAEGDKEIYVEKNGEISPITNNTVDDDAPYYDEVSNTAVWHRLIDARYQIIQYDFKTKEEKQLTHDRYNNMQPSVYGDAVVWQGWVGNDWEIFLLIGEELTMLTDNTTHDIAPNINGTHIVWQSFEGDAWRMKVYDITTGITDTIEDSEGGSIENPRFVLVYDTKFESGDVETRGYDLKNKEVVRLASEPTSAPQDIPDPDQTGEKRALVAPTTQLRQKDGSDENDDIGTTTPNGLDDGDLVIPTFDTATTSDDMLDIQNDLTLSDALATSTDTTDDPVLLIERAEQATTTIGIDDLIITPFVEPIATSTDAQEIIVSEA